MNTNDFEQGVVKVISDVVEHLVAARIRGDAKWTNAIFTGLTKFAYDLNLRVWSKPNSVDATINEWLYDFVIYEGRTPVDIDKVWVALESEWSRNFNEIKYDFYKLVQCRSALRVMIFQSENVSRTIDDLAKLAGSSEISRSGDRYIFAGWNDSDGFTFRSYSKG